MYIKYSHVNTLHIINLLRNDDVVYILPEHIYSQVTFSAEYVLEWY